MNRSIYEPKPSAVGVRPAGGNGVAVLAPAEAHLDVPLTVELGDTQKTKEQDAQAIDNQESEGGLVDGVPAIDVPAKVKTPPQQG